MITENLSAIARNFAYIDNSNLFIEGCRVSAVSKQIHGSCEIAGAIENHLFDYDWELDYRKLRQFLFGNTTEISSATVWGSSPTSDTFWTMVNRSGFRVVRYEKNIAGKEKNIDVAIAHAITKDAYTGLVRKGVDEITLVAGDGDYVPVVEDLVENGFTVHVAFWSHAAQALKGAATRFICLDPHHQFLSSRRNPLHKGMLQ